MDSEEEYHQLHIAIPIPLHKDLKSILPERGQITAVARRLLHNYVRSVKASKSLRSPLDSVPEEVAAKDIEKSKGGEDAT